MYRSAQCKAFSFSPGGLTNISQLRPMCDTFQKRRQSQNHGSVSKLKTYICTFLFIYRAFSFFSEVNLAEPLNFFVKFFSKNSFVVFAFCCVWVVNSDKRKWEALL